MPKLKIVTIDLRDNYPELYDLINSDEYKKLIQEEERLFEMRQKIRQIIKQSNLTQEELSNKMGIKQPQLSRFISGKKGFSWKTLEKFCLATGAKIDLSL